MAPRKKPSSKKSNQSVQQSQPSKFGIQHFFERHTQNQLSQNPKPNPTQNPKPNSAQYLNSNPNPNQPVSTIAASNVNVDSSTVSPEVAKSIPNKRFKFSPGLFIKQSQDDGGDDITWKISPVNERLKALTSKHLPGAMKVFGDSSAALHACSENQTSSCSVGKLEMWLSSPTTCPDKSVTSSGRVSFPDTEICNIQESNGRSKPFSLNDYKSTFQTPPSLHYGFNQLPSSVTANGVQHRKQLLELLDQVEDAITDDAEPTSKNLKENNAATTVKIGIKNDSNHVNITSSPEMVKHEVTDETFLVLEVSEKHRNGVSNCAQSPFKVLRLLNERSGQEHVLHLCDEWFYSLIGPGDAISVIGEFDDQGKCAIDHDNNLLIIHPDILVSGTRFQLPQTCCFR